MAEAVWRDSNSIEFVIKPSLMHNFLIKLFSQLSTQKMNKIKTNYVRIKQ